MKSRSKVAIFHADGIPQIWIAATMIVVTVTAILGIYLSLLSNGLFHFWIKPIAKVELTDGNTIYGIETDHQPASQWNKENVKFWVGGRTLWGAEFRWIEVETIKEKSYPESLYMIETLESGVLFGSVARQDAEGVELATSDGEVTHIADMQIIRKIPANDLNILGKIGVYLARFKDFLISEPREANTEGGIFPAIFGTVMMVFLMTLAVVPLGVITAVYLREYAKPGPFLNFTRMCINNLAGVPSIVFGMFGLGFFVYFVGGGIDRLFFSESLPAPTFGTGGILWASLTLALLTLPVVVVSTIEGLDAVPAMNRQGALALGATKWQTIWNVVLPNSMPAILTGTILAIGRAAGEVAPLMLTGVVKLAPDLPLDVEAPFVHLERKFMHLGFHIYDLAFQSPNIEASLPIVYATTGVLVTIVIALNFFAIGLRAKLRKKYQSSAV